MALDLTPNMSLNRWNASGDQYDWAKDLQADKNTVDGHTHGAGSGVAVARLAANAVVTASVTDGNITNAKLAADVARENLLTNPGLEIWHRGAGPFTTGGAYTADKWVLQLFGGTSTLSVSRDTANVDGRGKYSAACTFTLGTTNGVLGNNIGGSPDADGLLGQVVAFSARVKTTVANKARLAYSSDSGSTYTALSGYHSGSGAWETLSGTFTVPSGTTGLRVGVQLEATGTFYVDNATLVIGSVAADYTPLHPADDLARCLRYYERIGSTAGNEFLVNGYNGAGLFVHSALRFRAVKAVAATITIVGTWTYTNASGLAVSGGTTEGLYAYITITALGYGYAINSGAGSYIEVVANP